MEDVREEFTPIAPVIRFRKETFASIISLFMRVSSGIYQLHQTTRMTLSEHQDHGSQDHQQSSYKSFSPLVEYGTADAVPVIAQPYTPKVPLTAFVKNAEFLRALIVPMGLRDPLPVGTWDLPEETVLTSGSLSGRWRLR